MEKNVEDVAMKKDRQIEQLKAQMVATSHQFQQEFNDRVSEGLKEREKDLRLKYVTLTTKISSFALTNVNLTVRSPSFYLCQCEYSQYCTA